MKVNSVEASVGDSNIMLNQNRPYQLRDIENISLEGQSFKAKGGVLAYRPAINLEISYEAVEMYEKMFNEELNIVNGEFN